MAVEADYDYYIALYCAIRLQVDAEYLGYRKKVSWLVWSGTYLLSTNRGFRKSLSKYTFVCTRNSIEDYIFLPFFTELNLFKDYIKLIRILYSYVLVTRYSLALELSARVKV